MITNEDLLTRESFDDAIIRLIERSEDNGINVKEYGAVGDGITDDTTAFKNALASGNNIIIPEGIFLISSPLYINVNKQWIRGISSLSKIKASSNFTPGEYLLTFYSPDGDYSDREKREKLHGNFQIVGETINGVKIANGVRLGGVKNTSYEGHMECQIFQSIRIYNCNIAFEYGSHVYKDLFQSCEVSDCGWSIKSTDDQYDSGEAITFSNCGFWSGCLKLNSTANFIGCTIHLMVKQKVGTLDCSHYFMNSNVNFTNCHFEGITQTNNQIEPYKNVFYALNSNVTFLNCEGVITGSYYYIAESFFNCQSTSGNGRPSVIKVDGGDWKFLFGRLKKMEGDITPTSITKGNVLLLNIPWKYEFDGINLHLPIYPNHNSFGTNFLGKNEYIYMGGIKDGDTKNIIESNGVVSINIIRSVDKGYGSFGIYKIIPCVNKSTIRYYINITMKTKMTYSLSTYNNNTIYKSLYFLDKDKHIINDVSINRENLFQKENPSNSVTNYSLYQTFAIPQCTEYIMYGVGGFNVSWQDIGIDINDLYVELM